MSKKIVIIQGHPDPKDKHFCHALAKAYAEGAESAGHKVTIIEVAHIDFPLLRTQQDFDHGDPIEAIKNVQRIILEAEHLVMVYPLWFGGLPAYFKAFLEQVFRPGFAANKSTTGGGLGKVINRQIRAHCYNDGDAGFYLSLVLPSPQPEKSETKYAWLLRNRADRGYPDWHG